MADDTDTDTEVSELRKAAEGGKAAKAEAALAKKELAFVKAGIDTDSKPAQALLQSYSGDLTADAIKAEAADWGLTGTSTPAPEPEQEAQPDYTEDAELQNMRDSVSGTPAPHDEPVKSAFDIAGDGYLEDRKANRSAQDSLNRAYGNFIKEAAKGNQTAIFDPVKWNEQQAEHGHGQEFGQ